MCVGVSIRVDSSGFLCAHIHTHTLRHTHACTYTLTSTHARAHTHTHAHSIGMLLGEYIVAECWFGPTLASLYKAVPKEVQGTAQGLFSVLTGIFFFNESALFSL